MNTFFQRCREAHGRLELANFALSGDKPDFARAGRELHRASVELCFAIAIAQEELGISDSELFA